MTKGLYNPSNGKTYTYKGFIPLTRLSDSCSLDSHTTCSSSPEALIKFCSFDYTKAVCCLCPCHFEEMVA